MNNNLEKLTENKTPVCYGFQVDTYDFQPVWRRDYLSFLLSPSYAGKQPMQ